PAAPLQRRLRGCSRELLAAPSRDWQQQAALPSISGSPAFWFSATRAARLLCQTLLEGRHQIEDGRRPRRGVRLDGQPLQLRLDQLLERLLIPVAERRGIEAAGFTLDDHAVDRHRLGIKLALKAAELRCPDFLGGAQRDQRKALTARFDEDHALAAAEGEPS